MGRELSFVLINPYTIAKSRTGGVIARIIGRTDLDFVAARMFGPSAELVSRYANLIRHAEAQDPETASLIADYVEAAYAPDPMNGRPRRVMLLLFDGEDAVQKTWQVVGSVKLRSGSGATIRDTYGDYILNEKGEVQYFEPAVLVAPSVKRAAATLSLWARYSRTCGGVVDSGVDVPHGANVEKTLVMLKPDNFRYPSLRPGNIIDILSASGLRIVSVKKFSMTVAQAEEFYGPVRDTLGGRFKEIGTARAANALSREFGFEVPTSIAADVCAKMAPLFAQTQFESIVQFMTGYRPSDCTLSEKAVLGREECLALVYEGVGAVKKIRDILGPTDPHKAKPGSVRREFGRDIMVNAAHASDSAESARREMQILDMRVDTIKPLVDRYYGGYVGKVLAIKGELPRLRCQWKRRLRGATGERDAEPPPPDEQTARLLTSDAGRPTAR